MARPAPSIFGPKGPSKSVLQPHPATATKAPLPGAKTTSKAPTPGKSAPPAGGKPA